MSARPSRVAIVTGAGNGIGGAIARRLAAGGAAIAVLDIDVHGVEATVASIIGAGGHAMGLRVDVSREEDVSEAVRRVSSALGAPTILVNNAGSARDVALRDMSTDDWDTVHAVHLRGSFLMARAVVRGMEEARWGRIVQISSISAQGHAGRANYCAAKAGMHGLVKSLAIELGPVGVTANAIAPGLILTRMTHATARRRGLSLEEHLADAVTRIPVGRVGTPVDVAAAVAFLAGEDAGFISGQVLYVAGGPHD